MPGTRARTFGRGIRLPSFTHCPFARQGHPVMILPVVERELRVASRRRWTYWGRTAAALVSVLAMSWWVLLAGRLGSTAMGSELFGMTSFLAGCICLLAGPLLTADVVSSERREGTLGLLFLTDLRGWQVSLGKLAASSLGSFFCLVSMFPVLAVSMLMGGVSVAEYVRIVAWLLATMTCSLSLGLLASTMSVNPKRAGAWALGLVVMACGLVPAIGGLGWLVGDMLLGYPDILLNEWFAAWAGWISLVPAYFHAFDTANSKSDFEYLRGMALSLGLTLGSLAWASWRMGRLARDEGARTPASRTWWRPWRRGASRSDAQAARRRRLLDRGPMAWLVARHRWRATWLWGLIGLAALVNALWIYMEGGVLVSDLEALWIGTSLVLHLLLKLWMAAEAPSQFHEDRRSGAMELMLTTPLQADEIVSGRIAALRRLWTGPVLWVLATDVLHIGLGVAKGQGSHDGTWILFWVTRMAFLVADAWAFAWMGAWLGARTTGNRTTAPLLGLVLGLPWLGLALYLLFVITFDRYLFNSLGEKGNILFALVGGTLNSVFWAAWGRHRLRTEFRRWAILRPGERMHQPERAVESGETGATNPSVIPGAVDEAGPRGASVSHQDPPNPVGTNQAP